jgi:hypothetical protein
MVGADLRFILHEPAGDTSQALTFKRSDDPVFAEKVGNIDGHHMSAPTRTAVP